MACSLRPAETDEAALAQLAPFLAQVFARPNLYTREYLHWLYVENPSGLAVGMNAWDGDRLVGHFAVLPIASETDSGVQSSALALNTAVDAHYRGQQLFTQLVKATIALAGELGIVEIIAVANAQSAPGFVGRLGFHDCGALDAWISWRSPKLAVREAPSSWKRVFGEETLQWRARNPHSRYVCHVQSGVRSVLGATGWPGVSAVLRMEPADNAHPLPELSGDGRPTLLLWLGRRTDVTRPFASSWTIPARLRPSPLRLIYRPLKGQPVPDPLAMRFEAFDFDAY